MRGGNQSCFLESRSSDLFSLFRLKHRISPTFHVCYNEFNMHKLGTTIAFIFNKLFLLALVVVIVAMVPWAAIASTLTSADTVKTLLSDSDVYNTIPDNILDIVEFDTSEGDEAQQQGPRQTQSIREVLEENDLIDPDELIGTVKAAIGDGFLQAQVENLIDSTYRFLDGTDEDWLFTVSLSERSEAAATGFKKFVGTSLAGIPECTSDPFAGEEVNILEINCLPPGGDVTAEVDKFIDEVTAKDGIFGQVYSPDDLDISGLDLASAKVVYDGFSKVNMVFWLLFVGLSVMVALTAKTIHRGLKMVGIVQLILGALFFVAFGFLATSTSNINSLVDSVENAAIGNSSEFSSTQIESAKNITVPLAENLLDQISSRVVTSSVIILVVGAVSIGLGILVGRHHVEHLYLPHHHEHAARDAEKDKNYPDAKRGRSKPPEPPEDQPEPKEKPKKLASRRRPPKKIQ